MNNHSSKPLVLQAIDALKDFDRAHARDLLQRELDNGPVHGEQWKNVSMLASKIGEIDISVEAARRYAATPPVSIERLLHYWGELATFGRGDQALKEVEGHAPAILQHAAVLHFVGSVLSENGDFDGAERCFRQALSKAPNAPQTWFALAMNTTFSADNPLLAEMEKIRPAFNAAPPSIKARFLYGLAKAYDDCGDIEKSFKYYDEGAALQRSVQKFDFEQLEHFVDRLINDFTPEAMQTLGSSGTTDVAAIFINGLPRSGTTLVEQILVSHPDVGDGGEINLLRPTLIPTGDYSFAGGKNYATKVGMTTAWDKLAQEYKRLLDMRFSGSGKRVDKTLVQSHYMGFLTQMMPTAPVIWMRRNPDDVALSCYRTFFSSHIPWSWSLADIGRFFRLEDRLFSHWSAMFPDQILVMSYEALVASPEQHVPEILAHCGLADTPEVYQSHLHRRAVRTASVKQVRAPISTSRIGSAERYEAQLKPFYDAYHRD